MHPTDVKNPDYFHKVVDCQWACPAHTPVPEYIRMIAAGRYDDAYMVNWKSNVFPGILGRTCDRPCEPACRRGRVEEENQPKPEPVAICRQRFSQCRRLQDFAEAADLQQTRDRAVGRQRREVAVEVGDEVTLLGNGCLCCNTRSDLQVALRRLVADRDRRKLPHFERVLIETSKGNITVDTPPVHRFLEWAQKMVKFLPPDATVYDDASNNRALVSGKSALITSTRTPSPSSATGPRPHASPLNASVAITPPSPRATGTASRSKQTAACGHGAIMVEVNSATAPRRDPRLRNR